MSDILEALIETAGQMARKMLLVEGAKQLQPMWHLVSSDGKNDMALMTPWADAEDKRLLVAEVKKQAHKMGAVAALFVSEAWFVKAPRGADISKMDPPSQHPQRMEAVFAYATDNKGNTKVGQWLIKRDRPGGKIIDLIEEKQSGGEFTGRVIDGLLPPAKD